MGRRPPCLFHSPPSSYHRQTRLESIESSSTDYERRALESAHARRRPFDDLRGASRPAWPRLSTTSCDMQQPNEPSPRRSAAVIGTPRNPSIVISSPNRLENGQAADSDEEGRVFEHERGGGGPMQSISNLGEPQQDGMESKHMELSSMDESQVSHACDPGRLRRRARLFQAGIAPSSSTQRRPQKADL